MDLVQVIALLLLCIFYIAYLSKTLALRRQRISVNLLGRGNKPKTALIIENCLRVATLAGAVIQFISAAFPDIFRPFGMVTPDPVCVIGLALMFCGNIFFKT